MRILFMTDKDCAPQNGGIERVVSALSNGFSREGVTCFLLFAGEPLISEKGSFEEKYQLDRNNAYSQIRSVVEQENIDVLFSHFMTKSNRSVVLPAINRIKKDSPNIKHVALYHSQPGVELVRIPLPVFSRRIIHGVQIKANLITLAKQLLLRLVGKNVFKRFIARKCQILYDSADKLVLLNEKYISVFNSLVDGRCMDKYCAIGNPLPFDGVTRVDLEKKDKVLLVVSRMEEETKKLSKVLNFWKEVEPLCMDWNLEIVGDGPDKVVYESMSRSMGLRRVSFCGKQNPRPYYERSSLFLMTSDTEGWPMALLETMQFGCVPIVFNTFYSASLIVDDAVDGLLIPPEDNKTYMDSMVHLMKDEARRKGMALSAMRNCQRFSQERIVGEWMDLFNDLIRNENA